MKKNHTETITAIATPPGRGGIGIIRISGPKTVDIAKIILKQTPKPRTIIFSAFYEQDDSIIDEGLALFFKAPHSFTGEDVLELQGHGSPIALDRLLHRIIQCGARLAKPGEFSERAFLNDKIDLVQAEAIADLIDSSTESAARLAIASLQGEFSKHIHDLVDKVIQLRMYVEAAIDFPEEEIDFMSDTKIKTNLEEVIKTLNDVLVSAKQGALLREGMSVVISGKPNAGKSSLLNALSGRESAIVTEIAGTTRDVLREYIQLDGMPLHIIDTAGLQSSENVIEQEGIRRAWQEIEKADHVLLIVDDATTKENNINKLWPEFYEKYQDKKSITIIKNKIDLTKKQSEIKKDNNQTIIHLSAKTGQGVELLTSHLKNIIGYSNDTEGLFLARRRHLEALQRAKQFLLQGQAQLNQKKAGELLAEDLRQTQNALSEITGEFTTDDLLDKIFSSFCVGK